MLSRKDDKNCDCWFGDSEIVLHEERRYLKEGSQDTVALAHELIFAPARMRAG